MASPSSAVRNKRRVAPDRVARPSWPRLSTCHEPSLKWPLATGHQTPLSKARRRRTSEKPCTSEEAKAPSADPSAGSAARSAAPPMPGAGEGGSP
eukprot:10921566-Alexandrium_andersonii.AAC.1